MDRLLASLLLWVTGRVLADKPELQRSCRACADEMLRVPACSAAHSPQRATSGALAPRALPPLHLPAPVMKLLRGVLRARHRQQGATRCAADVRTGLLLRRTPRAPNRFRFAAKPAQPRPRSSSTFPKNALRHGCK